MLYCYYVVLVLQNVCRECFDTVLGVMKSIWPQKLSDEVLA